MTPVTTFEALDQFRAALIAREIVPPDSIIADGRLHRCDAAGARGRRDAAYLLHLDDLPAGGMENWRDGRGWQAWRVDLGRPLSAAEREAIQARAQAADVQRREEVARRHASARERAAHIWASAQPTPADHPYLVGKDIAAPALRVYRDALVVPVHDTAGNLVAVAQAIRDKHPKADIVVCADDDRDTSGNPGVTLARQAALAMGGRLAIPDFGPERPAGATDFNDLHRNRGLSAVLTAVRAATVPSADDGKGEDPTEATEGEWPEPEPLTAPLDPLPYPVDALPPMLRDAVREAQAFVQAPMALVACSALAVLSVASQGLVNVRRDRHLVGPVSLYLLALADSGERKTTCDGIFSPALRNWESGQLARMASELASQEAALAAFDAKKAGVLATGG